MALTKEIWIDSIVGNLFPDNSFASRSADHSAFVNNKTVHVPNAGAKPGVIKGRTFFPASVKSRTDNDLTYEIGEFTTDPFRVPNAETVELSYDKRESIIAASRSALSEAIHNDLIKNWVPTKFDKVMTSGEDSAAHLGGDTPATGNRKSVTLKDVLAVKKLFDKNNIPANDRCFLLDYEMYNQLLDSLTANQYNAFLSAADAEKGIIGKLYGFDFYMRSEVLRCKADGSAIATEQAATDSAAGLAWQKDCVSRALGDTELFDSAGDPLYYGDVFSALVRAGGKHVRYDSKGVVLLIQGS
jgi:hypothetical protein